MFVTFWYDVRTTLKGKDRYNSDCEIGLVFNIKINIKVTVIEIKLAFLQLNGDATLIIWIKMRTLDLTAILNFVS